MVKSVMEGMNNLFPHARRYEQGLGKVRRGQGTVVVALDGTGDFTSIQEGINALPSGGGLVYIKEGTYLITTGITIGKSNVMLQGSGKSTIIKTTAAINLVSATSKSGITVDNIMFLGNSTGSQTGIRFTTVTDSFISRCWFEDMGLYGVYLLTASNRCLVNNNIFKNCSSGFVNVSSDICTISNNHAVESSGVAGFYLFNGDFCNVIGNQARDGDGATTSGFEIAAGTANTLFTGNVAKGNTLYGFHVNGTNTCRNNTIVGNVCIQNAQYGIATLSSTSGAVLIANTLISNTLGGILDTATGTTNVNNTVLTI